MTFVSFVQRQRKKIKQKAAKSPTVQYFWSGRKMNVR